MPLFLLTCCGCLVCPGDGYGGERRQEGDEGEDSLRPTPPQDVPGHEQLLRLRERRDDEPGTVRAVSELRCPHVASLFCALLECLPFETFCFQLYGVDTTGTIHVQYVRESSVCVEDSSS